MWKKKSMELVSRLSSSSCVSDLSDIVDAALKEIGRKEGASKHILHGHLCRVISEMTAEWLSADGPHSSLLNALGPLKALEVIRMNITNSSSIGAKWLEREAVQLLIGGQLNDVLWEGTSLSKVSCASLTPSQNQLVKSLTRLSDLFASKRGRDVNPALYPTEYYKNLAATVHHCFQRVVDSIRNSKDVSVRFLASVVGKSSLLGDRESFWSTLCPLLEQDTKDSPLWQRVCHTVMTRLPDQCLESVLDGIMKFVTLSLSAPTPLYRILGNLPRESSSAKFILTHKYVLVRPPADPRTLLGYFLSSSYLRALVSDLLSLCLSQLADCSVIRHMSSQHHLRLSGIVVIATTCFDPKWVDKKIISELESLAMQGVHAHLESPVESVRTQGMVVGEHVMKTFHPSTQELKFTYQDSADVRWLKSLMEPVIEQEEELCKLQHEIKNTMGTVNSEPKLEEKKPSTTDPEYGTGFVQIDTCSDDDSDDDDLQPYDMSNDPESTHTTAPLYLRTCLQGLISKDAAKIDAAMHSVKPLISKSPPDLEEVSLELARVLLHIDSFEDDGQLRMDALVELTTKCPKKVASYLCEEFYSPHYNLKQRMDILEVLGRSAVEISSIPKTDKKIEELSPRQLKPWQQVVEDRIKAKTRIISKGSSKSSLSPTENKFGPVSGYFFFPLMVHFDKKMDTLDLQGRDSLVLGHLLHTLGTILHCAMHTPSLLPMSTALLNFCWTLKCHSDVSVRRGVLYCLCCMLSSSLYVSALIDRGLDEMLHWAKDIVSNESDSECRQLASLALSMFHCSTTQENM